MILLISPQGKYATRRLIEEAVLAKVPLEAVDVSELSKNNFSVDISRYQALYVRQVFPYFAEVISLVSQFRQQGKFVLDGEFIAKGMETSKRAMHALLEQKGVPMPATQSLPTGPFLTSDTQFPFVLKWVYGFGGKDTHLIRNELEYKNIIGNHAMAEWLMQEYIDADFEYEVFTIAEKAVGPLLQFDILNGFKADLGKYAVVEQSFIEKSNDQQSVKYKKIIELAELSSQVLGRELGKVDILEKNGSLFVLEVNRSPSLIPFEQFTGYNMAGEYIKYIREQVTSNL